MISYLRTLLSSPILSIALTLLLVYTLATRTPNAPTTAPLDSVTLQVPESISPSEAMSTSDARPAKPPVSVETTSRISGAVRFPLELFKDRPLLFTLEGKLRSDRLGLLGLEEPDAIEINRILSNGIQQIKAAESRSKRKVGDETYLGPQRPIVLKILNNLETYLSSQSLDTKDLIVAGALLSYPIYTSLSPRVYKTIVNNSGSELKEFNPDYGSTRQRLTDYPRYSDELYAPGITPHETPTQWEKAFLSRYASVLDLDTFVKN